MLTGATDEPREALLGDVPGGEQVEQLRRVRAELRVAGEEPEVGVELGGVGVVVAGGEVDIGAQPVRAPGARRARPWRASCIRARRRPRGRPLLPAPPPTRCCAPRRSWRAARPAPRPACRAPPPRSAPAPRASSSRGAVERLLDRQHRRILGGDLQEALHRGGERVVRMVDQQVALTDDAEQVGLAPVGAGSEPRVRDRLPGRLLERRSGRAARPNRSRVGERGPHLVEVVRPDAELVGEELSASRPASRAPPRAAPPARSGAPASSSWIDSSRSSARSSWRATSAARVTRKA